MPEQTYKISLNVNLVTVNAVVKDTRDHLVTSLKAEDFLVYDNGIPQSLTHFSQGRIPLAVAFIVQNSIGVAYNMQELKNIARSSLNYLSEQDEIVLFSCDGCPIRLTDLTTDKDKVAKLISGMPMSTSADHHAAIYAAARYLRDTAPDRRRAIIMISGNQVYTSENSLTVKYVDEKEATAELLNGSITLHYIKSPCRPCFGADEHSIDRIARASGGVVFEIKVGKDLDRSLTTALSCLREAYSLGFVPANLGDPGAFHRLDVKLKPSVRTTQCHVITRTGYYFESIARLPRDFGFREEGSASSELCERAFVHDRIDPALVSKSEIDNLRFHVTLDRGVGITGSKVIKWNLQINPADVKFLKRNNRFSFKLLVALFPSDGLAGEHTELYWQSIQIYMSSAQYHELLKTTINHSVSLPLPQNGNIYKFLIYDFASKKVGIKIIKVEQ